MHRIEEAMRPKMTDKSIRYAIRVGEKAVTPAAKTCIMFDRTGQNMTNISKSGR